MSTLNQEELEQIEAAKKQFLATGTFHPIQFNRPLTSDPIEERVAKARANYENILKTGRELAIPNKSNIKSIMEEFKKNPSQEHLEAIKKRKEEIQEEANKRLDELIDKVHDPAHKARLNTMKQKIANMKL